MMNMLFTLDGRIYGGDEEDIVKANFIERFQKKADEEIFAKRITGGLFDYYGIVPKED